MLTPPSFCCFVPAICVTLPGNDMLIRRGFTSFDASRRAVST